MPNEFVVKYGFISEDSSQITGSLNVSQNVTATSFTGSLYGTASFASSAKSASYVATASIALFGAVTELAPMEETLYSLLITDPNGSGDFLKAPSLEYDPFTNLLTVTASLATTASYVLNAVSASRAVTASYVLNAVTASYILNAVSSSFATTASYILNAVSSSFATTASYAANGGVTRIIAGPNITITSSSLGVVTISASSGGGGTPGGSNTQIQYNSASVFAGVPVLTYDGTTLRATGSFSGSLIGNATTATTADSATVAQSIDVTGTTTGTYYPIFTDAIEGTGTAYVNAVAPGFTYNASTNTISATASLAATASAVTALNQTVAINGKLGIDQPSPTSKLQVNANQNSISQSDANGILLANSTPATAVSGDSISPPLVLQGSGWASASAASQDVRFRMDVLPRSGSTPTGSFRIASSVSGAAYTDRFVVDSIGRVGIGTSTPTSASLQIAGNVFANSFTGSLQGTASFATTAVTASFVNTLNQNVIITGSAAIGTGSLGPSENTLTLGARDSSSEGGQLGLNAPGGTYTSASFIDVYQNRFRILRGTNISSDGEHLSVNLHTGQVAFTKYTNSSSFTGTTAGYLAFDTGGNIITTAVSGSSVGGGGTPGGSNTQIQYNSSNAFAGVPVLTYDGTTLRATGSFTGSLVGSLTGTASFASTASFVNPLNQNVQLTGSLSVSGNILIPTSGNIGINQSNPTSELHLNFNQNSVTQNDANGILLANSTPATANTQSISPAIVLQGNGWKTTASAGSQDVRFRMDVLPVQGTVNPTANLQIASSINGAAYSNLFTINNSEILSSVNLRISAGPILSGNQITNVGANASNITYSLINNGGSTIPLILLGTNAPGSGNRTFGYDNTNGLTFHAQNSNNQKIARASVQITNLVNTAASESADLTFLTKPGSPADTAATERMRITSTGLVGINQSTPTSRLHVNADRNSETQNDASGAFFANATAATANTQSISPAIVLQGNGWKTTATAGSQDVRFRMDVLPVQGSTNPTANLQIASSINGSAYANIITATSDGNVLLLPSSANSVGLFQGQLNWGTSPSSKLSYRTTNNGSAITPYIFTNYSNTTSGRLAIAIEGGTTTPTNGISFIAANGNFHIARASINITNLVDTAASESADLIFSTKPGSPANTAMTERMRITSTGNVGIGTTTPSHSLHLVAPSIPSAQNAFYISASSDGVGTSTKNFVVFDSIPTGSNSGNVYGFVSNLLPGYIGTSATQAGRFINTSTGTGTNIYSGTVNSGIGANASGITSGANIAVGGTATNGSTNIGNRAIGTGGSTANSINIGIAGFANTGSSTGTNYQIGGYFGLHSATPTFSSSAALMCDNGSQTSPIFVARDNGSAVFTIVDGGNVNITGSLNVTGDITADGNVIAYSDESLKENIYTISNALNKVKSMRGVTYTRNDLQDKQRVHAGVIAQEIEKELPEVVYTSESGIKSVAYGNIVSVLIEAIKEQQNQIDDLRMEINQLKNGRK